MQQLKDFFHRRSMRNSPLISLFRLEADCGSPEFKTRDRRENSRDKGIEHYYFGRYILRFRGKI